MTQGNKFEAKKMSYEKNFGTINSHTNYDNHGKHENGKIANQKGIKQEYEKEKDKIDYIRNEVENENTKSNVKLQQLEALGYIPSEDEHKTNDGKEQRKGKPRSVPGMVRQTFPSLSDRKYKKYDFRLDSQDLDKY